MELTVGEWIKMFIFVTGLLITFTPFFVIIITIWTITIPIWIFNKSLSFKIATFLDKIVDFGFYPSEIIAKILDWI